MSEETRQEIMKAHIQGHDVEFIAECNNLTATEVADVLKDQDAIAKLKTYMDEQEVG